jgi:hypothetical protein
MDKKDLIVGCGNVNKVVIGSKNRWFFIESPCANESN